MPCPPASGLGRAGNSGARGVWGWWGGARCGGVWGCKARHAWGGGSQVKQHGSPRQAMNTIPN